MTFRALVMLVHRWLGLTLFALLTLQCISGLVIQFEGDLERLMLPDVMEARTPGTPLALDVLAARAGNANIAGGRADELAYVATRIMPGTPQAAAAVVRMARPEAQPREIEVFVDPVSGAVQGWRDHDARGLDPLHLIPTLRRLHTELLCGDAGQILLAVVALLWLPLAATGLIATLPRRFAWSRWKRMWSIRVVSTDAHRAGGLWLSVFALVLALTTVLMVFDDEIFGDIEYRGTATKVQPQGFDAAAAVALRQIAAPDGAYRISAIRSELKHRRYRIDLSDASSSFWQRPNERVYLDADGSLLGRAGWLDATLAQRIRALALPAHTGEVFGEPGQWLMLAAAVALATHFIFGFLGWLRRTGSRR